MLKRVKFVIIPALAILLIAASFTLGCGLWSPRGPAPPTAPEELDLIGEAWEILFQDSVDKQALDPRELRQAAIEGMLRALGDPYASYLDAEHYKLAASSFEGSFEGIGAVVTMKDGQLTVIAPIASSPADQKGIRPGDQILEVDGQSTADMDLTEAVLSIRGQRGSRVTLSVLHPGDELPVDIEIIRDRIEMDSVYLKMVPEDIAYIKITYFSERTDSELASALEEIQAQHPTGIILDLRNNPGGSLQAAVAAASYFLKEGLVLYALDSEGKRQTWNVIPKGLVTDLPLAVLVNNASASASEVVAGALQDRERAPLIGTRTTGKGSINHFRQLSDGSAIYITIARWFTPNGRQIEGQGLSPDIEVQVTAEDLEREADPQLEQAIEYLMSPQAARL